MTTNGDVIDLTDSFTLINHCQLADVIIELDESLNSFAAPIVPDNNIVERTTIFLDLDDSVRYSTPIRGTSTRRSTTAKRLSTAKTKTSTSPVPSKSTSGKENSKGFGDCPVCWDQLGRNSLASTKCGHVFCLQCISQVVEQTKRCPTCRCVLKGSSAFHPLYL